MLDLEKIVIWHVLIIWPWQPLEGLFLGFLQTVFLNKHLQSRRHQSCHVRSHAGHRRHPQGHLWRRGRPARGPSALLSVWMTALWAGHGLGARDHTHIHTAAAATTTRCPRWARHWPARPGRQNREKKQMMSWHFYCCALHWTRLSHLFPSGQLRRFSSVFPNTYCCQKTWNWNLKVKDNFYKSQVNK